MTGHITYKEMTLMYGPKAAQAFLRVLETSAHSSSDVVPFDHEERMRRAFEGFAEEEQAAA